MKKMLLTIAVLAQFAVNTYAQHFWTMAVKTKGEDKPAILEYHSEEETAENGVTYMRIYESFQFYHKTEIYPYNEELRPTQQPYGYRMADKQIFIYDFVNKKETLAFDFNLAVGDRFTTFNGLEWKVEAVKDTLVSLNVDPEDAGQKASKRLLTVKTLDGKLTDQWLEDFGSFNYHLMIGNMENVECAQTLWMEYRYCEYFAREITSGPIYAHDSGWDTEYHDQNVTFTEDYTKCYYENGKVTIERVYWGYDQRDYTCFYLDGDDIYQISFWEFGPFLDCLPSWHKYTVTFDGLPAPASGKYTVHINDDSYTTGISHVALPTQAAQGTYDLQGRRMCSKPTKGMYIKDGKKVYAQ